jgi:hypothetical protein
MEKKRLVAVTAVLMSSLGTLPLESARAADATAAAAAPTSAYEDSSVDASLDPGEERISAYADDQARLKDLRYAYFIGYNARAREDSKSYANLADEVKHPQKPLPAAPEPVSPKPVAERAAPTKRVAVQAAPLRQVSAPVASPKRVAAARATPPRQVLARAEPVPLKRVSMQVESVPPKHVLAPVAPEKPASPPRRAEAQPVPLKQASTRTRPSKLFVNGSEPPILVPTQAVAALPESKPDEDDAQVTQRHDSQNAQRAAAQYGAEPEAQAAPAAQNGQPRQYPYRQPQQQYTAAAPAYNQASTESQESGEYTGRAYAPPPPPPRTVQASQYAPAQYPPAQYQQAYAQSTYVPRPPTQAVAQRVVVVGPPPGYQDYSQMYTPPELRRPYPAGYGNQAQPAGYQGWE